jgi:hypothetical protein
MLAVRFVREPDWAKALTRRKDDTPTPAFALLDFTPTRRENGTLSFYWLEDVDESDLLASAFWLTQKDSFDLVGLDRDVFEGLGLEIKATDGHTFHPSVNPHHFDVLIKTADDAKRLADTFFQSGQLLPVEERSIKARIANDNAESLINFKDLAGSGNQSGKAKICELLKDETLHLCTGEKSRA